MQKKGKNLKLNLHTTSKSASVDHPRPGLGSTSFVEGLSAVHGLGCPVIHVGVHACAREVGAPHGPRVALDGVFKKQLLDLDIIRLTYAPAT